MEEILMVGCGNAPLSPDMCKAGYKNLWNTDISPVVIDQMRDEFPDQKWDVMDAMDTKLKNNSIKYIIDKSLIDTLMCASESKTQLKKLMDEMFRILTVDSIFITFSLHSPEEVVQYFEPEEIDATYHWKTDYYRVKSSRWNETDNRRTSVCHTLIVCKKLADNVSIPTTPRVLNGVMTDEEFLYLRAQRLEAIDRYAFNNASVSQLMNIMNDVLLSHFDSNTKTSKSFTESGSGSGNKDIKIDGSDDNDDDDDAYENHINGKLNRNENGNGTIKTLN